MLLAFPHNATPADNKQSTIYVSMEIYPCKKLTCSTASDQCNFNEKNNNYFVIIINYFVIIFNFVIIMNYFVIIILYSIKQKLTLICFSFKRWNGQGYFLQITNKSKKNSPYTGPDKKLLLNNMRINCFSKNHHFCHSSRKMGKEL